MKMESLFLKEKSARFFLLCHGEISKGLEKRYIGQTDYELSETGRKQAELWRWAFASIDLDLIISSDLKRSRDTAQIIKAGKETEIKYLPGLREIALGQWEDKTFAEVEKLYPCEFKERGNNLSTFRPPEGENYVDLQIRVWRAIYPFLNTLKGNILIVSHAGVNRVIIGQVLDIPLDNIFSIRQDYGRISILTRKAGQYTLAALNLSPDCL
jgi:broad specificity phosphatase PhoE